VQERLETVPKAEPDPDLPTDHNTSSDRTPDPIAASAEGVSRGSPGADDVAPMAQISGLERERLVRLASRVTWNREEADDAVQDALITAHEKSDQLRDRGKRWSWLCRIVIQKCYEQGRQQKRRTKHQDAYASYRETTMVPGDLGSRSGLGSGFGSEEGLRLAEVKELVRHAIPRLSPRQQQVLILKDLEGMDYADVAEILQISPSTARVHAKDAREALRDLIKREHPEGF
jgi:RNA polymerase sigma-70 factor, ECF subfamily